MADHIIDPKEPISIARDAYERLDPLRRAVADVMMAQGKCRIDEGDANLQTDGWTLGTLTIAGGDVQKLLRGHTVGVNFVQQPPSGWKPFAGYAGTAWLSFPRAVIHVRLNDRQMSTPLDWVRQTAREPNIDAGEDQTRITIPGP